MNTEVTEDLNYRRVLASKAADALRKARKLMNDSGAHWMQGDWNGLNDDGQMSYCSVGALREVIGSRDGDVISLAVNALGEDEAVIEAVRRTGLSVEETEKTDRVINWNDAPDRTWEEVSQIFQRAEEKLRASL